MSERTTTKMVAAAISIPNHEKATRASSDETIRPEIRKVIYQYDMKEYFLVSSFKVIRSSDNMEMTKQKTQSTFSKNTVLKSRQSTASLHSFFCKL